MITCTTKQWGNSLGIIIPRNEVIHHHLQENQQVVIDIITVENPLKELFGSGKNNKITKEEFLETRKLLESGRF